MKIVLLDSITLGKDLDLSLLAKLGDFSSYQTSTQEEIIKRTMDADIVLTNKCFLNESNLHQAKKLKYVGIFATGLDNLDLDYLQDRGVTVKNAVGYSTDSVAQHTLSFVLNLLGNSSYYYNYTQTKQWIQSPSFTHLGSYFSEIAGKNWGIIGLGTIGSKVAQIADAFGAKVSYTSISGKNTQRPYPMVSLTELLKNSDIITIHLPLTEQTKNLLNLKNLNLLKEGAVLVNVGRGGIINESDLKVVFGQKKLKVGLDVLDTEPMSKNFALLEYLEDPNLLITPHIAWASTEARSRLLRIVTQNLQDFLNSY